jgi:hypothetical protein
MHTFSTLARNIQLLLLAALAVLSVTTLQAQSKEVATVIELEGQVSVLRGGQVALFQKGTPGVPAGLCGVNAKEEIVTGPDGHAVFQINDGSRFEVFPNSRVTFQGQWTIEDMLELFLGKIRVQIEHRDGPNPKKVSTPTAVISVRGTVFDVAVEDDDGTTYVGVEDGQVLVQHRLQPGNSKTLNRNEWLRVYPNQPLAKAASSPGAIKFALERAANVLLNNPGGIGLPGGSSGGGSLPGSTGGSQGDGGRKKNPAPTGPPPGGGD